MAQEEGVVASIKGAAAFYLIPIAGLITVDPVCKMEVNPDEAAASFIYQEKPYYICHPACREAFEKDPESCL